VTRTKESQPEQPRPELGGRSFFDVTDGKFSIKKYLDAAGAVLLPGYQLRYIYFIDKTRRKALTVPEIPFSRIDELGAGMYRGERITMAERHIAKEEA
jgi:cellobiose-specific phosphotransferase system component IIB